MGNALVVEFQLYIDDGGYPRWHAYGYHEDYESPTGRTQTPAVEVLGATSQVAAAIQLAQKWAEMNERSAR